MSNNQEIVLIELRQDSAVNWQTSNAILNLGEPAIAIDSEGKIVFKIGNGIDGWNTLPAQTVDAAYIDEKIGTIEGNIQELQSSVGTINSNLETLNGKKLYRHSISVADNDCVVYITINNDSISSISDISELLSENEKLMATGCIINGQDAGTIIAYVDNTNEGIKYCGYNSLGNLIEVTSTEHAVIVDTVTKISQNQEEAD